MASLAEAADIYRVNGEVSGSRVAYSFFVIDAQPTPVQTGFRRTFAESLMAVRRVTDPAGLRYTVADLARAVRS